MKKINIQYYALLREERGLSSESLETEAATLDELYGQLRSQYQFKLGTDLLRVAVNNEFVPWATQIKDNDTVVFIPPVAGG